MTGGPQRARKAVAGALLLVASSLLSLAVFETGLRLWRGLAEGSWSLVPAVGERLRTPYPSAHDPQVGYIPRPNSLSVENYWGNRVTIDADGTRSNGRPDGAEPLSGAPPILALGDSFTFGDEVDDDQTWPAHLEQLTGRRVINAGVFGYGFDQIVLRAEQLLVRLAPAPGMLIVSLIADDVQRCEYSYRYAWKPYFDIRGGALELRNVPVPSPGDALPFEPAGRRWARKSYLADFVMRRIHPDGWLLPQSVRVHRQGRAVSELLVDRLRDRNPDLAMLLVVQWDPNLPDSAALPALARARLRGIPTLHLKPLLAGSIDFDEARLDELFLVDPDVDGGKPRHMHDAGNRFVAQLIAERLASAAAQLDGGLSR